MHQMPPGPLSGYPEMIRYYRDPYACCLRCRRVYGDIFTLPSPMGDVVYTGDPDGIKEILTADPATFDPFAVDFLTPVLGEGSILVARGERHRAARKLLTPPFHGERMRAYGRLMVDAASRAADRWQPGRAFQMLETAQSIALDVIIRAVFGVTEEARAERLRKALIEFPRRIKPSFVFFKVLQHNFFGLSAWSRFQATSAEIRNLIAEEIAAHRQDKVEHQDILSLFLSARYDDGSSMSDGEIFEQLMTLLVAGHETTATMLAWVFHSLYRNPNVLSQLVAELESVGPSPEPEAIVGLPYLDAVCLETLRLYPVLTHVVRLLKAPLKVMGYEIPAGKGVAASIILAHRREETYPEPDCFRPERFLGKSYSSFEFFPFGGGARRCLGAAFALYEIKLVAATILQRYRLRLLDDHAVKSKVRGASIIGPATGIRMVMERPLTCPEPETASVGARFGGMVG